MLRALLLSTIVFLTTMLQGYVAAEELVVVRQDFYSLGKKDIYETLKKAWLQQLTTLGKSKQVPPMLTLESKGNPEYITLVQVNGFGALSDYLGLGKAVEAKMGSSAGRAQREAMDSILHFQVFSLGQFLPACSSPSAGSYMSLLNRPFVHYFIYSLSVGQGSYFEEFMQRKVAENKEKTCWRVWKVLFGAESPKYILAVFSTTQKELAKDVSKIDMVDPSLDLIIRQERDGKGILRPDLSYFPGAELPGSGRS